MLEQTKMSFSIFLLLCDADFFCLITCTDWHKEHRCKRRDIFDFSKVIPGLEQASANSAFKKGNVSLVLFSSQKGGNKIN